jgi:hypothetical protein
MTTYDSRKGYEVYIFSVLDSVSMVLSAVRGSVPAQQCVDVVEKFLNEKDTIEPGNGPLCLMCEYRFNKTSKSPMAFAVLIPAFPDPGYFSAIASPICIECCDGRAHDELFDPVLAKLREMMPSTEVMKPQ